MTRARTGRSTRFLRSSWSSSCSSPKLGSAHAATCAGLFLSRKRAILVLQISWATPRLGLFGFQLVQRQTRQHFWVAAPERRAFLSSVRGGNSHHSAEQRIDAGNLFSQLMRIKRYLFLH